MNLNESQAWPALCISQTYSQIQRTYMELNVTTEQSLHVTLLYVAFQYMPSWVLVDNNIESLSFTSVSYTHLLIPLVVTNINFSTNMDNTLPITDSHVHFWDTTRLRYIWLDEHPTINQPFLEEDYHATIQSRIGKVDTINFVQCDCIAGESIKEVDFVSSLATRANSKIKGIVAFAPLEEGSEGNIS
jgi:hypothetical protein